MYFLKNNLNGLTIEQRLKIQTVSTYFVSTKLIIFSNGMSLTYYKLYQFVIFIEQKCSIDFTHGKTVECT